MFNTKHSENKLVQIYNQLRQETPLSRKKIKKVLEENHPYSSQLLDKLPGVVFCCVDDENWSMIYLNKNFELLTGFNYLDVVMNRKYTYEQIILCQDRAKVREVISSSLKPNGEYEVSYRIATKEGQIKWVSEIGHHLGVHDGHNILEGFIIDITDLKQTEEQLARKNEFINSIIANLPIGIAVNDIKTGKLFYSNNSLKEILGYDISQGSWESYIERLISRQEYQKVFKHLINGLSNEAEGVVVEENTPLNRPDGQKTFITIRSVPLPSQNMVVTSVADTTEINKAAQKIRNLNRLYTVLSNINQAIVRQRDETKLLTMIPAIIKKDGKFPLCWIGTYDSKKQAFLLFSEEGETTTAYSCTYHEKNCPVGSAIMEGKPYIAQNIKEAPDSIPCKKRALDEGLGSAAFFPIVMPERENGFLAVFAREIDFFRPDQISLFDEVAVDISFALKSYRQDNLRENLQRKLIGTNNEMKAIIDASPLAIVKLDREGRVNNIWNRAAEDMFGFTKAEVINQMLPIVSEHKIAEYKSLVKTVLSGKSFSGVELKRQKKDGSIIDISLATAPIRDHSGNITGILGIISDITDNKKTLARVALSEQNLRKLFYQTIEAMSVIVETKDPYTSGHQRRVGNLANKIAEKMKLSPDQREMIKLASMVHDIGKIYIPQSILSKPGRLSDIEFSLIKLHPQNSYEILNSIDFPWPIAELVLQHHERIDGSGYPRQLKGDEIMLESKILAVADVVEAMAAHRPYRPAPGIEQALKEINKNKGKLYDPVVVEITNQIIKDKEIIL